VLVYILAAMVVLAAAVAEAQTAVEAQAALVAADAYLFTTRIERKKCLNLLY
jgi:hypothetical protein